MNSTAAVTSSDAPTPLQPRRGRRRGRGRVDNSTSEIESGRSTAATRGDGPEGRGRRGRGRGRSKDDRRTATTVPPQESQQTSQRQVRQRGRGRAGYVFTSGRQFSGHLTARQPLENTPQNTSDFHADAAPFVPNQKTHAVIPRPDDTARQTRSPQRQRRHSVAKSTAPDLPTRIHEDIENAAYECPICASELTRNSKVWSCKICWTVFHLSCIKKWSTNDGSTMPQRSTPSGESPEPRQWRCPGCNLPQDTLPTVYTCWCGKETDPKPVVGLQPHSCGQTCAKARTAHNQCPHPCESLCHAGPCPPCNRMGPSQTCFCGRNTLTKRCADTDYDHGWSCGKACDDLLPCGIHTCKRPCHEGLCGSCEERVHSRCYCGKVEQDILCSERDVEVESRRTLTGLDDTVTVEKWMGSFKCGHVCGKPFDCGKHVCEKECHRQSSSLVHCPRSPDVVTHCPCGKTLLTDLLTEPRRSCEDEIPNCKKECLKHLLCGHVCHQICHAGECAPCTEKVEIPCRCGRNKFTSICHQGTESRPFCMRVCKATLNCKRHECGQRCCTGEQKAHERQIAKRKFLRMHVAFGAIQDEIEPEHICTRICGRPLKCGSHTCAELCHPGPCLTCKEAIFDEISCHCGRTVLQPPLPCGTKPPICRFDCERPKACGHVQVAHNCHEDEEKCPKCPFLVSKECMCGKKVLKNQPCWLTDVRCGEVCGRLLKCGSHMCRRTCHRPGDCEDVESECEQPCGKPKKCCGHPCEERCHAPFPCKEESPCPFKLIATCPCQNLKQEVRCNASKYGEGNFHKTLSCNDECARLERNRKLAVALNIDPEMHEDNHIPYSTSTLLMYQENPNWAQVQEREFRIFAADENEKRLRFKPMRSHERRFIHALAEDFGFDSESMDPEPHRHVCVFKTPRFVMAPMKTLARCLRIRQATATESSRPVTSSLTKRLVDTHLPFNGYSLRNPRFGLTVDELRSYVMPLFKGKSVVFDIRFQPNSDTVLLKASMTPPTTDLAACLKHMKPVVANLLFSTKLADAVFLCILDSNFNIIRNEPVRKDAEGAEDGWSEVVAKAPPARQAPKPERVGKSSTFTVLGSRVAEKRREEAEEKRQAEATERRREAMIQKDKEEVVEDWEEAMAQEEMEQEQGGVELSEAAETD